MKEKLTRKELSNIFGGTDLNRTIKVDDFFKDKPVVEAEIFICNHPNTVIKDDSLLNRNS